MFKLLVKLGRWLSNKYSMGVTCFALVSGSGLYVIGAIRMMPTPAGGPDWSVAPLILNMALMVCSVFARAMVDNHIMSDPTKSEYGFFGLFMVLFVLTSGGIVLLPLAILFPLFSLLFSLLGRTGCGIAWLKEKFEDTDD